MKSNNYEICYLCSKEITKLDELSKDHVISKQFIKRNQPLSKDFDYGSFLPTHKLCNRKFGDADSNAEFICQKALILIDIIQNPNKSFEREHRDNSKLKILAINGDHLKDFSKKDLEFFGLIDVREKKYEDFTNPEFFKNKEKINPMLKPLNSALTVLVKNSAALLVKRYNVSAKSLWRVIIKPCYSYNNELNLKSLFGNVKPFEEGLNIWVNPFDGGDWFIRFQYFKQIFFVFFSITGRKEIIEKISEKFFKKTESYYFQSNQLIDLVNYNWYNNCLDKVNINVLFNSKK